MPNDRLLVCDDHQDSLEVLTLFLGKAGFDVVSTGTGYEAIHIATEQEFNAFVLDSWLPDISGAGLSGAIREFDSTTPIIIYSAIALPAEIEAILSQGAQAYIVNRPLLRKSWTSFQKSWSKRLGHAQQRVKMYIALEQQVLSLIALN